jgi:hypothetical protein
LLPWLTRLLTLVTWPSFFCDTKVHTIIIIIVGFVALHLVDYSHRKDWIYAATTSWSVNLLHVKTRWTSFQ